MWTASSVAEALEAIREHRPAFALLDVNLGAETSFPIAERLSEEGIRVAFATGYGEQIAFPVRFADAPKIRKPYTPETLTTILCRERPCE